MIRPLSNALPTHTPEWTDFNQSDPGVTVLEALAWPLDLALYGGVVPERSAIASGHGHGDAERKDVNVQRAQDAFLVRCDRSTMTQDDIDQGRLIVTVGVAPVKPAEFVILRFAHKMGGGTGDDD